MKQTPRFLAIVILVVVLLTIGFLPRIRRNEQLAEAASQSSNEALPVTIVKPVSHRDPGIVLPGSTVAAQEAVVNARSIGYVARWYVDIGARVKQGQVLADIAAPDVDAQYRQAHAQTAQGQATVRQSQADGDRLQADVSQAVSQQEGAQAQLLQAQANVGSFESKVLEAQRTLKQSEANRRFDEAQLTLAQREYARYRHLGEQGFVTLEQVDQQEATFKSATAKVEADEDAIKTAEATVEDARASLRASQAGVTSAQAAVRSAQDNVRASRSALTSGLATVEANQATSQADAQNEEHYNALAGFEKIRAPFAGVVTARNVDVGSMINAPTGNVADTDATNTVPKTGLFAIARIDPLLIQVQLPQAYVAAIAIGQPVDVTVREMPGEIFKGKVTAINAALDAGTRTEQVKVAVPNAKLRLRPGLYADVHMDSLNLLSVEHLPSTTLIIDAKGTRVAVVDASNVVHLQTVVIGRDLGAEVEIVSGLKGDEQVVNAPTDEVKDGVTVAPRPQASPSGSPR